MKPVSLRRQGALWSLCAWAALTNAVHAACARRADAIFSERASPVSFAGPKRPQAPGLTLQQLPHIDLVVVSHNHYDHCDAPSLQSLNTQAGGPPLFLVPLGLKVWLTDLGIEPRWFMKEQHADPDEALRMHQDLRAKKSLGIHWGTFELTDEPLDEPPRTLARARARAGVSDDDFFLLALGQTHKLSRRVATQ